MAAPERSTFDLSGFFSALDAERAARRLSWRRVADEAGVSASTLTRMSQGKRPDVDGLVRLSGWAGLKVEQFTAPADPARHPQPLTQISTFLRADRNLTPEAADALDQVIRATYERLARP